MLLELGLQVWMQQQTVGHCWRHRMSWLEQRALELILPHQIQSCLLPSEELECCLRASSMIVQTRSSVQELLEGLG